MLRGNLQSRRVLSALQRMGWAVVRSAGSHTVLQKVGMPPLVLPLGHPTVRATTALAAIRRAGEDVARFEQEY
jgi:predicted RNA binding protein YcfA (HicA-like mRNA interferase family)